MNMKRFLELTLYVYFAVMTLGVISLITDNEFDVWSALTWFMSLATAYYIYTFGEKK